MRTVRPVGSVVLSALFVRTGPDRTFTGAAQGAEAEPHEDSESWLAGIALASVLRIGHLASADMSEGG